MKNANYELVKLQIDGITNRVLVDEENNKCFVVRKQGKKEVIFCYVENQDKPNIYGLAKDAYFSEYVIGANSQNFARAV